MIWFRSESATCPRVQQLDDVTGSCHNGVPTFQIMDIINKNEVHFLSSLQKGSRLIQRTLSREDYRAQLFPGQWGLGLDSGLSGQ